MARTRRPSVYITNTHPAGRTCGICNQPVISGQGAYVTTDGRHANHSNASDCATR